MPQKRTNSNFFVVLFYFPQLVTFFPQSFEHLKSRICRRLFLELLKLTLACYLKRNIHLSARIDLKIDIKMSFTKFIVISILTR